VDFGLFETFGVHPVAGRLFDRHYGRDSTAGKVGATVIYPSVILNETAARRLGYASPSAAIGHMMLWGDPGQVALARAHPQTSATTSCRKRVEILMTLPSARCRPSCS